MQTEEITVIPSEADGLDFVELYKRENKPFPIILLRGPISWVNDKGPQIGSCANIRFDPTSPKDRILADVELQNRDDFGELFCFPDGNVKAVFVQKRLGSAKIEPN